MSVSHKREFRVYSWASPDDNYGINSWSFEFFPSICIERWKYETGGWWFCFSLSWLVFGITFDWRSIKDEIDLIKENEK